jgi:hypothetical protein
MTAPTPDWVEQARRFAAALAADHGAGFAEWADQARRFTAGLAAEHAQDAGPADAPGDLGAPAGATTTAPADAADHAAECRWCPLCAGLAALRGRRPDLVEALADVLSSAATALRAQSGVPARTTRDGGDAAPDVPARDVPAADVPAGDGPAPPEETVTHPAPAPVQRIDVA